jgi:predicted flap endonuclease-1-like 5' DNA nuclease
MTTSLAEELRAHGIYGTQRLLDATRTPADREKLAERAGVESRAILELANRTDLSRVWGVAGVYSDLLEQAGVDTVRELAARNPDNLHAKLLEVNVQHKVAGRVPSRSMVERWIAQAKELPRRLEY